MGAQAAAQTAREMVHKGFSPLDTPSDVLRDVLKLECYLMVKIVGFG
jgi:hypothetical protein